jgi:hypothetical protein
MGRAVWAMAAAILLALIAPGCGNSDGGSDPKVVAWSEAQKYDGQYVTVRGPVVDVHFASATRGQPTFINLGRPHPDPARFTVLIWGRDRTRFPKPPEEMYAGKKVRVTGKVQMHAGLPEIVVVFPDAIQIAE